MTARVDNAAAKSDRTWLSDWRPEDGTFWENKGRRLAWLTLGITTANLIMAFIVWFVVSALVVRLPSLGFKLTSTQLFWLAAMPGLAGGTLRIIQEWLTLLGLISRTHDPAKACLQRALEQAAAVASANRR